MSNLRLAATFVIILFAGCSPGGPPPGTTPASAAQVEHIRKFLKPGLSLSNAHVVRSQAQNNAHFFAARIVGSPQAAVGVWIVSGAADFTAGTTWSVNVDAKEYSVAPDGSTTKAQISMADPPAADLHRFVASLH